MPGNARRHLPFQLRDQLPLTIERIGSTAAANGLARRPRPDDVAKGFSRQPRYLKSCREPRSTDLGLQLGHFFQVVFLSGTTLSRLDFQRSNNLCHFRFARPYLRLSCRFAIVSSCSSDLFFSSGSCAVRFTSSKALSRSSGKDCSALQRHSPRRHRREFEHRPTGFDIASTLLWPKKFDNSQACIPISAIAVRQSCALTGPCGCPLPAGNGVEASKGMPSGATAPVCLACRGLLATPMHR